jgi:hypothetical protein
VDVEVAAGGSPVSVTVTVYAEPEVVALGADFAVFVPTIEVTVRLRTFGAVF